MKNIIGKFSLREMLQIVIPGIYFIGLINPVLSKLNLFSIHNSLATTDLIIDSLLSLIIGMIIYTLDLPKRLWFFKKYLPTKLISENFSDIKNIHNNFFQFYDDKISDKQKNITEKYTSIYHFSVNIGFTSLILSLIYLIVFRTDFLNSYGVFTFLILILSVILTYQIFFGDKKIKYMFKRQYDKFVNSVKDSL